MRSETHVPHDVRTGVRVLGWKVLPPHAWCRKVEAHDVHMSLNPMAHTHMQAMAPEMQ